MNVRAGWSPRLRVARNGKLKPDLVLRAFANLLARMDPSRLWANTWLGIALTHRNPVFAVPIVPASSPMPMAVAHDHQLLPIVIMVMALAGAYVPNTFAGLASAYDDPVSSIPAVPAACAVAVPPTDHNDLPTVVVVVMAVASADVRNGSGGFAPAYDDPESAVPMVPAVRAVTMPTADHHDLRAIVVMVMAGSRAHMRATHVSDGRGPIFVKVQREAAPLTSGQEYS